MDPCGGLGRPELLGYIDPSGFECKAAKVSDATLRGLLPHGLPTVSFSPSLGLGFLGFRVVRV